MRYADGDNFTIDLEHGVAVVRVFKVAALDNEAIAAAALALIPKGRMLSFKSDITGMVLDLRRVPGAVAPRVEAAYQELAALWEATGQAFVFLLDDPVGRMQATRLLAAAAPRFGALFAQRDEARRFAGATDLTPSTVLRDNSFDRVSRRRSLSDPD